MKVKIKCHICNKEFKAKTDNLKEAKRVKRDYKAGTFTCWGCMNIKDGVYGIGIMS